MFTQSHNFYPLINGQVSRPEQKFFHDTNRCVKISNVLVLNSSAHVWLPTQATAQAYKNMATTKEIANYIATTRQGDKAKAITQLVLGV